MLCGPGIWRGAAVCQLSETLPRGRNGVILYQVYGNIKEFYRDTGSNHPDELETGDPLTFKLDWLIGSDH